MRYFIGQKIIFKQDKQGDLPTRTQIIIGKAAPLKRMKQNDKIIYYSPKLTMESKEPYQAFTALGEIADETIFVLLQARFLH